MSEQLYQIYLQLRSINKVLAKYGKQPIDVHRHMLRLYEAIINLR